MVQHLNGTKTDSEPAYVHTQEADSELIPTGKGDTGNIVGISTDRLKVQDKNYRINIAIRRIILSTGRMGIHFSYLNQTQARYGHLRSKVIDIST